MKNRMNRNRWLNYQKRTVLSSQGEMDQMTQETVFRVLKTLIKSLWVKGNAKGQQYSSIKGHGRTLGIKCNGEIYRKLTTDFFLQVQDSSRVKRWRQSSAYFQNLTLHYNKKEMLARAYVWKPYWYLCRQPTFTTWACFAQAPFHTPAIHSSPWNDPEWRPLGPLQSHHPSDLTA